jgi:hypothetical protein
MPAYNELELYFHTEALEIRAAQETLIGCVELLEHKSESNEHSLYVCVWVCIILISCL